MKYPFKGEMKMSEFVFLYRGGERAASREDGQQIMQKWTTWMKELGAQGHLVNPGHPLEQTGKVVSGVQRIVTDGPFAEKDLVGGFTIVKADDIDHAVELSKGCPIFEYKGDVEVRPIMQMDL
jgi:hypothetical protein